MVFPHCSSTDGLVWGEKETRAHIPHPHSLEIWMPLIKKKKKALFFCHGLLSFCPMQIVSLFYKVNRTDLLGFAWTLLRAASPPSGVFLWLGPTHFKQPEDAIACARWNLLNSPVKKPHISWYAVSLPASARSSCCVCLTVPCSAESLCLWAPSQRCKAWSQLRLFLSSVVRGSQSG